MKGLCYGWLDIDHLVLVLSPLFVTISLDILNPLIEWLTYNGEDDVADPLSWQPMHVPLVWQILLHDRPLVTFFDDSLATQLFILWDKEDFGLRAWSAEKSRHKAVEVMLKKESGNDGAYTNFLAPEIKSFMKYVVTHS